MMPLDLLMFCRAHRGFILIGYPVAFTIAGVASAFACSAGGSTSFPSTSMGAPRPALLRRHDQSGADGDSRSSCSWAWCLKKSRIAEELLEDHGPAVRPGPRRAGRFGHARGRAAGCLRRALSARRSWRWA